MRLSWKLGYAKVVLVELNHQVSKMSIFGLAKAWFSFRINHYSI